MIRSLGILLMGVLITALFSLYAVLLALFSPGEERIHRVARNWARVLLRLADVRVRVLGGENILVDRPQIFMANHQSHFDIFAVLGYIPGEFRWIAKNELFRIPVFGLAMKKAGYIPIDRGNHEKALSSIVEAAKKIQANRSVMSFPEGTRSEDGTIGPFKSGMFHLAMQADVPVTPVTIIGAAGIWPKHTLQIGRGQITLVIDQPVDVTAYTPEMNKELIKKVRDTIIRNYDSYGTTSSPPQAERSR